MLPNAVVNDETLQFGNCTLVSDVHFKNADAFRFVICPLHVICVSPVQSWNALLPMLVRPLGSEVRARLVQLWNALLPMLVRPLGSDVRARLVQFWNAYALMLVRPLGSDVRARVVQL